MTLLETYLKHDFAVIDENEDDEVRIWKSTSKKSGILIQDMDTNYIQNCINFLLGNGKTPITDFLLENNEKYLKWFREELIKRNLK